MNINCNTYSVAIHLYILIVKIMEIYFLENILQKSFFDPTSKIFDVDQCDWHRPLTIAFPEVLITNSCVVYPGPAISGEEKFFSSTDRCLNPTVGQDFFMRNSFVHTKPLPIMQDFEFSK